MRVPWLAGALAAAIIVLSSTTAGAAPIEQIITDPLATTDLTATFVFDNDVALFRLIFGEGSFTLTGTSTSAASGFDPILALFGPDGAPVPYLTSDGVESTSASIGDIDADVALPLYNLAGGVTYTLAVSQFGPFVGNFPKGTLADGFELDADEFQCFTFVDPEAICAPGAAELFGGQSGTFAFALAVTSNEPQVVPEPGTFSLMALASLGAAVRRCRARRRTTRSQL